MAVTIPIANIVTEDRQRKTIERGPLQELKDSIATNGLLHPIVVLRQEGGKFRLIAGERRLTAIKELWAENRPFPYDGPVNLRPNDIPATVLKTADLPSLLSMEYEENMIREQLTWQEQVAAVAAIEQARKQVNPKETQIDLAKDLQKAMGGPEKVSLNQVKQSVSQSLTVASVLANRPDLQKAKSSSEAYKIIREEQARKFQAELASRKLKKIDPDARLWDLKKGDLTSVMLDLPENQVDLILVDPPYGIGIDKEKFAAGTFHRYDDSEQTARDLSVFILQEGWRVTKSRANVVMFCSWKSFDILHKAASQYGWAPWHHPIIWQKSTSEGSAPWGRQGFLHTYEILFFATKGQRGINGPIPDILTFQKVPARLRKHGAEKPLPLLEFLIDKSTSPGDLILDPCAGSGSTLLAASNKKRRSVGIELDETYYNLAMSRLTDKPIETPDVLADLPS